MIDIQRFEKHKNSRAIERFNDEVKILRMLNHKNVIKLLDIYCEDNRMYLVMPLCQGGDLLERIITQPDSYLDEEVSKFFTFQITQAIDYLHTNSVVHRDLKPENILLETTEHYTRIRVCDFGFSKIVGESEFMQSMVGTPAYLAPEVLRKGSKGGYDGSVDLWSLGVIVYVCVSGTFPFNDDDIRKMTPELLSPEQLFPNNDIWMSVSDGVKSFIRHLLKIDEGPQGLSQRYTAEDCLKDSWLSSVNRLELARTHAE